MNQHDGVTIEELSPRLFDDWIALRCSLWPDGSEHERRTEAESLIQRQREVTIFLARSPGLVTIGFAEATLRYDYVNGCATSPVAFLEGIYVQRGWRRRGVARRLCDAVEKWASEKGCSEFASDTEIGNAISERMHLALGFQESERVVCFCKQIGGSEP